MALLRKHSHGNNCNLLNLFIKDMYARTYTYTRVNVFKIFAASINSILHYVEISVT